MNTTDLSVSSSGAHRVFVQRSPGVEICVLRRHADGGLTFLIRMEKGARAERHGHPGGEDAFLLSGRLRVDRRVDVDGQPRPDVTLDVGDHLFAPPGEIHEGFAEEATTLLVSAPGGIVRPGR
jgi:quercetin dioxygenase-like cupin family protein